jgi:hypothetical protein
MVSPVRYPSGVSTFKPNHILSTFPTLPNAQQGASATLEMFPYIAGQYTVTATTATVAAGTGTPGTGFNGGILSLAVTTASGGKAGVTLNGNSAAGQGVQFIPGQQVWFNTQVAHNSTFLTDATTVARYGLFDTTDPTATITNGVYFEKFAGAGGALNLVIKNTGLTGSTVTTTINNVADLARPSGLYGDTSSTVGTLTTAGSSNKYTSISVATTGNGYVQAPLVRALGASGSSPFAQLYCVIGSGPQGQASSPGNIGNSFGGGLYAPYIAHVGGTGYTTFTNEVNHWVDLSLYYNGRGQLFVGVNGKTVFTVGIIQNQLVSSQSVQNLAAGGTATTGNAYYITNASMTTSIAPVLPAPGTFDLIMPMSALNAGIGYALNTNTTNIMFADQIQAATEYL